MTRATNQELCDEFRKLLTEGAKASAERSANALGWPSNYPAMLLEQSKPWRGELWAKFAEIERRLCPQPPDN